MQSLLSVIAASGGILMAAAAPAWGGAAPVTYQVGGNYFQGCFNPCLCIISYIGEFSGSFRLEPVDVGGPVQVYNVTDVQLSIDTQIFDQEVTGSGVYRIISGLTVTHQLELDLNTGFDGEIQHFDSGMIIGGFEFPDIDITVTINNMKCYDTVLDINASPSTSPADLNGDGAVDGLDLGILLSQWSTLGILCGPICCPADLNGDCVVDGLDVGVLLAAWTG